ANMSSSDPIVTLSSIGLFVMAPVLLFTLIFSYTKQRFAYKVLVICSALVVGVAGAMVNLQASAAGMSYYFAGQTGWIFIIWLVFGMQFRIAARCALVVTITYMVSAAMMELPLDQLLFEGFMLLAVNLAGSYSCYQLEYSSRKTFLESKLLEELAGRDGLTGLYNRRSFDHYSKRVWRQSHRERDQLTIMMIDIDRFKDYNDMYGHQAGDDALKQVATVINESVQRPLDMAARFGGEEFALVLYGPANSYGHDLPDRIRKQVENMNIIHEGAPETGFLTISIGVAIIHPGASRSLPGTIQMADEALYEAKETGRNRVVIGESGNTNIQTGQFRVRKSA
ncbi:MAG: GGDEF domain-containing protein, partial [Gammaproteobacteria bacterium]|nr:GGDEF domain-containing protein [Gammaproteobacteria bacterium]